MQKFLALQLFAALKTFDKNQRRFILLAFAASFLISCDYSIVRPAANSLFISAYGTHYLPYAWLFAVPFNFLLVSLYNHFLPRFGSYKIFVITALLVIATNVASSLLLGKYPGLSFFFYIWKEVYILLSFQQLWSEIHRRFNLGQAKFFYGAMYGVGALGATFGSLFPSFCALESGSKNLLLLTIPFYLLLLLGVKKLMQVPLNVSEEFLQNEKVKAHPFAGIKLILRSKPLFAILLIVTFMQLASTLTDFQFNSMLANAYPETDLRTQENARILSGVHICTLILQFLGSYMIIGWLGIRRGHVAIPLVLLFNSLIFLFSPTLLTASLCYITIKSFDFSLFGVLKEMLYVPLKLDEKFRAKSFIDIFAYRGTKSIASLLILVLQVLLTGSLIPVLSIFNVLLFLVWMIAVTVLLKENKEQIEVS